MDGPLVWIIGSDPDIRHLIGLNLSRRGFQVVETCEHDLPTSVWAKPDLIILDVESPDESGWEAISRLRQSPWAQGAALILLLATVPRADRLVSLQPVYWIEKPLNMDSLLAMIRKSLG